MTTDSNKWFRLDGLPTAMMDWQRMTSLVGIGDDEPFELRLAQTISWCESREPFVDPMVALRSVELRPRVLEVNRAAIVHGVVGYRATRLDRRSIRPVTYTRELAGGRLLVYWPEDDLFCGAAETASDGFFDVNNTPPWDTWVALFQDDSRGIGSDYLVSWVPASLVETAARGIEANPEQCIAWLADTDTPVARLARAGDFFV